MVEPHSSTFRVITTNVLGVRIFRKFTLCLYSLVCGGTIQANAGTITSPGYPNNYPANTNCSWLVVVATGRTVSVQFDAPFNIQGNQGSCGGDYVQVTRFYYIVMSVHLP